MSATATESKTLTVAEVLEHLIATGTGKDKIDILKVWSALHPGATGEELLSFLIERLDGSHPVKDEATNSVQHISIGTGTVEKIGQLLHGPEWRIPNTSPSLEQDAAALKQRNSELQQQLTDAEYERDRLKAELKKLKEAGPGSAAATP